MKKILCILISLILNVMPSLAFEANKVVQVNKDIDYTSYININDNIEYFTSKLGKKFVGHVYVITNNYDKPLKLENVELNNTYTSMEAFKKSQVSATPGSITLSVLAGLLALPTFGISCALLVPAVGLVTSKNVQIKSEAKKYYDILPNDVVIEPQKNITIKTIGSKTQAINRIPNIKLNFIDPETNKNFVIDNKQTNL